MPISSVFSQSFRFSFFCPCIEVSLRNRIITQLSLINSYVVDGRFIALTLNVFSVSLSFELTAVTLFALLLFGYP